MHASTVLISLATAAAVAVATPLQHQQHMQRATTANGTNVVTAKYDGSCFYPESVSSLDLESYLGVWYQVAGYDAIFTSGCKCITANYTLNSTDGTVHVVNQCQSLGLPVSIEGTAVASDAAYGAAGVFAVTLAGVFGDVCPGPNYIVQDYVEGDYAIVQSPSFGTLFVLSRVQNVTDDKLEELIARSVELGSVESEISITDQSGCLYT